MKNGCLEVLREGLGWVTPLWFLAAVMYRLADLFVAGVPVVRYVAK